MDVKIDTAKIPGFDALPEEVKNALASYTVEVPDQSGEIETLKGLVSKRNAEVAEAKRKLNDRLSEQEKAALETQELIAQLKAENERFRASERVAGYKAKLMEAGYDAESADAMSKSLPDGVEDSFFTATKSFIDAKAKQIQTDLLDKQSSLSSGGTPKSDGTANKNLEGFRKGLGL